MSEHTPGPWQRSKIGGLTIYGSSQANRSKDVVAIIGSRAEASANARLIAAAPVLLAALKVALDVMTINEKVRSPEWDGEATEASAIGNARAAIAEAAGVPHTSAMRKLQTEP